MWIAKFLIALLLLSGVAHAGFVGTGQPVAFPGWKTGVYYSHPGEDTNATSSLSANTAYANLWVFPVGGTPSKIGISVTATGTATECRIGVYKYKDGVPDALVLDTGALNVQSTGEKEYTNTTYIPAGYYAPLVVCNGTVTTRSMDLEGEPYGLGQPSPGGGSPIMRYGRTNTTLNYGPMPSTFGDATAVSSALNHIKIYFKF